MLPPRLDDGIVTASNLALAGLEVVHVSKHFEGVHALSDVSLTIRRGEVHALVGENGAGKSTLVKVIAGVHPPDAGHLLRDGSPVTFATPRDSIEAGIAVVYQEPSLLPLLTVEENLMLGHEPRRRLGLVRTRELRQQAERLLEAVGGEIHPGSSVQQLSIAQRQLVEIAKALSLNASVVVMDEPTSSLSLREVERLERVIEHLKQSDVAVVFVSHDLSEVLAISDRITVLKDGHVMLSGPTEETDMDTVIRSMVGRDLAHLFPPRTSPSVGARVVMEVRGMSVSKIAQDVSFELREGMVTGFIGLIGAGRSEVARAIFGAERRSKGDVLIDGAAVRIKRPADAVALGIAFVPEDRQADGLILDLAVATNISLPQLSRLSRRGILDRGRERALAKEQIRSMGIRAASELDPVRELSGGNQQKVVLSKWLARGCRVLILDEPTRGVDVGAKVEIYRLIRQLAEDGAAVMLVSSELPEILHLSDRILVMSKGAIVADLANEVRSEADIAAEELMIRSALGLEPKGDEEGRHRVVVD
jgi:rhamnose transport system ATP-binding protein